MRLGKVQVTFEYVVDLDNQEMVDYAKESIREDIDSAVKYTNPINIIQEDMEECKFLEESDIAEFLLDQG